MCMSRVEASGQSGMTVSCGLDGKALQDVPLVDRSGLRRAHMSGHRHPEGCEDRVGRTDSRTKSGGWFHAIGTLMPTCVCSYPLTRGHQLCGTVPLRQAF